MSWRQLAPAGATRAPGTERGGVAPGAQARPGSRGGTPAACRRGVQPISAPPAPPAGSKVAAGLYVHPGLSAAVGTCTAAFARCMLAGHTQPGVWFPEERGALSDRRALMAAKAIPPAPKT